MDLKQRSYYLGFYDVAKDLNCHELLKGVPDFRPCDRYTRDPESYREGRTDATTKYRKIRKAGAGS